MPDKITFLCTWGRSFGYLVGDLPYIRLWDCAWHAKNREWQPWNRWCPPYQHFAPKVMSHASLILLQFWPLSLCHAIVSRGDWLWKSASFKERCLCYDFCIVTWSRKCTQNHRSSTLVVISALFVSFLRVFKHYILIIVQEIYIYVMPGVNCSVFGCGSCRRTKGMGIWKLPLAKDEAHGKWRDEWLGEIKKTREMDQNFREQLKNDY